MFFFEIQYLFVNFIFEERKFLPFMTSDRHNNCPWLLKNREKNSEDKFDSHKENSRNEQSAPYASRFFRCYDYRITLLLQHGFTFCICKKLSFWCVLSFLRIDPKFTSKISQEFLISVGSWDIIQNSISFWRTNQNMCA